ncbi:Cytochrome b5 isoform A (AtCb5-A) (Cytochrome b5 isoform D) (AtCb5-D) [Durusdinium trenchii]|uniref:Cytochrome b5 isoform A (AtCb5-A) (Cytochrome b5 isoform D) (AtCb5-D) n=1 Tax=Durusdinium trenchii TaxID=1381693 RepID=A0ABP0MA63_9DINO
MGNACPHRAGAKAEASITAADVRANGWLVIFGKVYNVKDYMVKHPGGQDILLGVLGGDATVEFETMRHSQLAQKQLEQLFVGRYAAPAEPGESMAESQARERVTLLGDEGVGWRLTGGRASSRDGISESDPQWWDVKGRGFLPAADPVKDGTTRLAGCGGMLVLGSTLMASRCSALLMCHRMGSSGSQELPRPWDCLGQLTEFIPSFAVQARFRELAETELRPRLPSSYKERPTGERPITLSHAEGKYNGRQRLKQWKTHPTN